MMATQEQKTVAFVLYPGLTLLDLVGPLQVFASLRQFNDQYRPVVVAERLEPMATDGPLKVIADHTFGDVPDPEVVIVPGGGAPTIKAMATPRSATTCARLPTRRRWWGRSAPGR
jgi:putative intracellular protease/amidase